MFVQLWLGFSGNGKTQLRPKWTGWCKLKGNFITWFPVTLGGSTTKTDHYLHLCLFFMSYHLSTRSLYNQSSAAFSVSTWKAGLLISQSVCSDCMITSPSPSSALLPSEKVQTPLNSQWWKQKKFVANLSANALLSQLELHVLPGNLRSLNIVSGQIRGDEHAASSPGMLCVELAGKR